MNLIHICVFFVVVTGIMSQSIFPDDFNPDISGSGRKVNFEILENNCDETKLFCSSFCADQTNVILEKLRLWGNDYYYYSYTSKTIKVSVFSIILYEIF